MNELYSIKSETLTGICDVLRSDLGDTKTIVTGTYPTATYVDANGATGYTVISIPGATVIYVDITYQNGVGFGTGGFYQIAPGALEAMPEDAMTLQSTTEMIANLVFENTDTITIYREAGGLLATNKANAVICGKDADGNYVDFEGSIPAEITAEVANTFQSDEIAGGIQKIIDTRVKPSEESYKIIGSCIYRFSNNGWNWFIEQAGDKITTQNISNMSNMFLNSSNLKHIPFDLNCNSSSTISCDNLFDNCAKLEAAPRFSKCKIGSATRMFANCNRLRDIPDDFADGFVWTGMDVSSTAIKRDHTFFYCYSLRKLPMDFLAHGALNASYSSSIYYYGFYACYGLDEIVDLPIPHTSATWTSNAFYYAFQSCIRLKNLTFALNNGEPYVVKWKSQTIDLSNNVGYGFSAGSATSWNSGITADKEVTDDASYQALKNDPDWFTLDVNYSRYNHDSAVATINSLPNSKAYGTNTIKFKGASGAKTDGGAINTLTSAEIAVATAKGWTVTLV